MKVKFFYQNGHWFAEVDEPRQAWVSFGNDPADAMRHLFDIPDVRKYFESLARGVAV